MTAHSYPKKIAVRRIVDAARDAGLDVGAIEVSPDGSIRIIEARAMTSGPVDEFSRWEKHL